MIQRRMLLSPDPAPPVNSGEPENTMASREPCLCSFGRTGSNLAINVLEKEEGAVVHPRQPGSEAAREAPLLMSRRTSPCWRFQSTPKGGLVRK